jgi:transposase
MRHRYDLETKERAVRLFEQRRGERPEESRKQALQHLSGLLGVPADTIRGWVDRERVDAGEKPGVTTAEREEIRALRKELAEVKRANEILKTASAFFAAAELDRKLK